MKLEGNTVDKVFYNGKIVTMQYLSEEEERKNSPQAVLVRDGLIAAVGTEEEVFAAAGASPKGAAAVGTEEKDFAAGSAPGNCTQGAACSASGTGKKACGASGNDVEFIDLRGKCLMPGFIDPHGHFIMNGQMAMMADLSDCTSHEDIIRTLREYRTAAGNPPVIMGFGYDHNFLKEGTHPDRRVLDQVSTEIPICILHVSIHFGCGNSALLHLANIHADTPDPAGGKLGRLDDSGEPSGYFEETALHMILKAFSIGGTGTDPAAIRKMQESYLRYGVTTAQDGATSPAEMKALLAIAESGGLKMDVVAYPLMSDHGVETLHENAALTEGYRNHVKIGGYKLVLDGSPQGRSAWMSQPYLGGEEGYCAYPWLTDEEVENYIEIAALEGRQVLAHCNGDAASEQFITSYAKALEKVKKTCAADGSGDTGTEDLHVCEQPILKADNIADAAADQCIDAHQAEGRADAAENLRPVMIHCQTVRNDQLDRMKELDMIGSIFVGHVWYWGDVHMKNFGPERGSHISPVRDALARGIHVNFHQDAPVTRPDVMHSVWCAVNRISRRGNVIGEDQKIGVYDALRAVTAEGAYEYFEEDSKGSIETGKRADLVILEKSPLDVPPIELKDIRVCETIKDGETVYRI